MIEPESDSWMKLAELILHLSSQVNISRNSSSIAPELKIMVSILSPKILMQYSLRMRCFDTLPTASRIHDLRQFQRLNQPARLSLALFIQILEAIFKDILLTFVVKADVRTEFVLKLQLNQVVRVEIPRLTGFCRCY